MSASVLEFIVCVSVCVGVYWCVCVCVLEVMLCVSACMLVFVFV